MTLELAKRNILCSSLVSEADIDWFGRVFAYDVYIQY